MLYRSMGVSAARLRQVGGGKRWPPAAHGAVVTRCFDPPACRPQGACVRACVQHPSTKPTS